MSIRTLLITDETNPDCYKIDPSYIPQSENPVNPTTKNRSQTTNISQVFIANGNAGQFLQPQASLIYIHNTPQPAPNPPIAFGFARLPLYTTNAIKVDKLVQTASKYMYHVVGCLQLSFNYYGGDALDLLGRYPFGIVIGTTSLPLQVDFKTGQTYKPIDPTQSGGVITNSAMATINLENNTVLNSYINIDYTDYFTSFDDINNKGLAIAIGGLNNYFNQNDNPDQFGDRFFFTQENIDTFNNVNPPVPVGTSGIQNYNFNGYVTITPSN